MARDFLLQSGPEEEGGEDKLPTPQKAAIIEQLTDELGRSVLTIITDYRGLSVVQMQTLRSQLREHQADMRVAKNTLTKRAAKANSLDGLDESLEGPTALVFSYDDPTQAAKVVTDFARTSRILQVKAAILEGQAVSSDRVQDIADLPSRDVLLGKLVGGMISPLYGLVGVLSAQIRSVMYVLQARANQLGESESGS